MASRVAINNMRNLPVKTAIAYEGALTRYSNSVSPMGGLNEGAAVYAAPIAKGDLVKLKAGTDKGIILVEKFTNGNEADVVSGMAVAHPQGMDNTTVSGQVPVVGLMRRIDVAFFGLAIIELVAEGTMIVGNKALLSENVQNGVIDGAGVPTANGGMVNMAYATVGEFVPVLIGFAGYAPAD